MTTSILFKNPKFSHNIGIIARSAELFGAERMYISDHQRVSHRLPASDTAKSFRRIGAFIDDDIALINDHKKRGFRIIAIEMDDNASTLPQATSLRNEDVLLVVGAEDSGLPKETMQLADDIVVIPTARPWSLNVAVAASIAMYERYCVTFSSP